MNIQDKSRYRDVYAYATRDPEGFWGEAAREIDWIEPATKVFDASLGIYGRWFAGAVCNTCYNALDRHVADGRADQLALIHDSPLTNSISKFTYAQLLDEVKTLAAVMQDFGVTKGDRVIIYMPLVPEAVVAMLACARIGAVHSVVFGGFAAKEVVISTLGTAYSLGEVDPEESAPLAKVLAETPGWGPVKALALIVFIMFYAPCFVTVVCMVRESGSWKWGLFSMAFNTVFAFSLATLVYQVGKGLGLAG